jgi:hypothetical protein
VRSILRILIVGLVWAGLEASVLVLSVLLLGTVQGSTKASTSLVGPSTLLFIPYSFGPLPKFPIGWLIFPTAFGSGLALADFQETVKATALATFTGTISGLLIVYFFQIPFPGVVSQGDAQAAFFGFMAIPLFLLGVFGGLLGCIVRGWIVPALQGKPS